METNVFLLLVLLSMLLLFSCVACIYAYVAIRHLRNQMETDRLLRKIREWEDNEAPLPY